MFSRKKVDRLIQQKEKTRKKVLDEFCRWNEIICGLEDLIADIKVYSEPNSLDKDGFWMKYWKIQVEPGRYYRIRATYSHDGGWNVFTVCKYDIGRDIESYVPTRFLTIFRHNMKKSVSFVIKQLILKENKQRVMMVHKYNKTERFPSHEEYPDER